MAVFVLNKQKNPLMLCSEKRARLLLERGRAVIVRRYPFTIWLRDRVGGETQLLRLKLDPGSRTTGLALVREEKAETQRVLWLAELQHRGATIRDALSQQRAFRRRRRGANLRYCQPRFNNLRRLAGWLAPSLRHRVDTTMSWVVRLCRLAPVSAFDIVRAVVPSGEKAGTYTGRIAVRATGSFNIQTAESVVQGISHRYGRQLQRSDGYAYFPQPAIAWNKKEAARQAA
jgi:hypothetical protein